MLYENGKVYRELTYPLNYMNGNGELNNKEEVKSEKDTNGNKVNLQDFNYLQFDSSTSGKYTLKLKPVDAEGSYKVVWSDKLIRKWWSYKSNNDVVDCFMDVNKVFCSRSINYIRCNGERIKVLLNKQLM